MLLREFSEATSSELINVGVEGLGFRRSASDNFPSGLSIKSRLFARDLRAASKWSRVSRAFG